jgi:hypothetical protein
MNGLPGNAGLVEEAGEVDDAVLLGEKRGELVSDDGANVDARLKGLQGAEPLRGAPTSILDRVGFANSGGLVFVDQSAEEVAAV